MGRIASFLRNTISAIFRREYRPRVGRVVYANSRGINAASGNLPFSWAGMSNRRSVLREKRETVTKRVRDLFWNNPHGAGAVKLLSKITVGDGLTPIPSVEAVPGLSAAAAQQFNRAASKLFKRVSKSGQLDAAPDLRRCFETLEFDAHNEMACDGEAFVHRVYDPTPGRIVPLALEIVDSLRVRTPFDKLGDPKIVDGVEYADATLGRVAAYWVATNENPAALSGGALDSRKNFRRIPARDMVVFREYTPSDCLRAISLLAPIAISMELDAFYMEDTQAGLAEAVRMPLYIETDKDMPATRTPGMADSTGTRTAADGTSYTSYEAAMETGIQYGLPGERAVQLNENLPAPDLPGYRKAVMQHQAIAFDLPLPYLDRDMSGVSYSGGKFADEMARPTREERQRRFFSGIRTIWEWFVDDAVRVGALSAPGYSWERRHVYAQLDYIGGAEAVINPTHRAAAAKANLALGLTSKSKLAAEDGDDFGDNYRQLCRDYKTEQDIATEEGVDHDAVTQWASSSADVVAQPGDASSPSRSAIPSAEELSAMFNARDPEGLE